MSVTIVDVETRTGWRYFTDGGRVIVDRRPYQPRLETTGGFVRHQYERGATLGRGGAEADAIALSNADRVLDALHRAVDGRRIVVRRGERGVDGKAPSTLSGYTTVFEGRVRNVDLAGDTATLNILSRQAAIAEAAVTDARFDGTATSGGAGLGGNVEMAGKPMPILIGYAYNFSPPAANPYDGIYQVSHGWPGHSVAFEFVKDRGAAITAGTEHAALADLQAATPTAGTYDWYSGDSGTFIFPGTPITGVLTVAATEGGGRTVAEVAAWLLARSADVESGTVEGVAAMNALVPGEAGIWIGPEDRTIGTALEEVLMGVGWWADSLGQPTVTVGAWAAPAGSAQSIAAWEVLEDVELLSTGDVGGGAPIAEALVGYRRNYTPLTKSDLEDTVAEADAGPLSQEYRLATATVEGALARNPLAQTLRVDTSLKDLADAQRIADRHRDLRANGIDLFRAPLATSRVTADIGAGVTLVNPRYGLADGALCGLTGRDDGGRTLDGIAVTDLILWRPSP